MRVKTEDDVYAFRLKLEDLAEGAAYMQETTEAEEAEKLLQSDSDVAKKESSGKLETNEGESPYDNKAASATLKKKVQTFVNGAKNYISGKRKKKLAANQIQIMEQLNDQGLLSEEEAQALDDYKAFIAKKEGKTVCHASRSARTIRSVENHIRKGVPKQLKKPSV